jgi:nitrogen fixation NifU-like protein
MSDDLRDLYQDLILDHGKNPRNFRPMEKANHEALGHNPVCGDKIDLFLSVDDKGVIEELAFQGSGCAISVASASMMTEMLKGKTLEEAERLFEYMHNSCTGEPSSEEGLDEDAVERIKALSGVREYPIRVKCATLPWHTLQAALKEEKKKAS